MHRKIALIISIILMAVFAAHAEELTGSFIETPDDLELNTDLVTPRTPAGYEWSSPMGALKKTANPNTYIFDTTSGNFLTDGKQVIVGYNTTKKKGLTDLGVTLKGKLMKIEDVSDVAVGYRRLWIQKYPLSSWDTIMPHIFKIFL